MRRKLKESEVKRRQSWMDLMQAYGESICITFSFPLSASFHREWETKRKKKERMRDKKKGERGEKERNVSEN